MEFEKDSYREWDEFRQDKRLSVETFYHGKKSAVAVINSLG